MSEQLEQIKAQYIEKLKQVELIESGVDIDNAEQYSKYITADNEDDIALQAAEIAADLNKKPGYIDPSVNNGRRKKNTWNPFN